MEQPQSPKPPRKDTQKSEAKTKDVKERKGTPTSNSNIAPHDACVALGAVDHDEVHHALVVARADLCTEISGFKGGYETPAYW
jgi:hypothetical protein